MTYAIHSQHPIPSTGRLADLPRRAQFLLLTLRLAHEMSVDDRNFQGFVYALCGISRVERALRAVREIVQCLSRAPRALTIEPTIADAITEDERRLLELLHCRWDFGLALAGTLVPVTLDETLIRSLNRLADTLE